VAHTDPTTEPAALEAALHYASLGLRVIPIAPGKKHPPVPEWQKAATCDPAIIEAWWTGLYRGHGVGIATGPGSGVWVLDVDTAGAKVGAASLTDLEESYGPLPATVESITGTGGRHLFFTCDPAHPVRNNQSGKAGVDLDVRGDGGQVVAAPTIHPATGVPYRWRPGRAFGEIAVAPAPPWLYGVLEREDDPSAAAPPRPSLGVSTADDDSPAAAFNASTTWDQLLTRDGWTLASTLGSGEQRWRRPGKAARDGISATVGHGGRDVLKVFTSSVPELRADEAYSRFGYEAAVRHHGDRSAFATHLRRQMNEAAGVGQHDLSDLTDMSWLGDTITTPALEAVDAAGEGEPEDDEWPDPEPLEAEISHGPAFPVDALPKWMADMVYEVAEALLVPVDLPAMAVLGALSTVAMTKVKVQVAGTSWQEDSNLYLMCGFPSGGGKSPAFAAAMAPVNKFEAQRIAESEPGIEEAQTRLAILAKREKATQDSASLGNKTIEDVLKIQAEARMVVVPPSQRFIIDDATPEALAEQVVECGGRAAQLSAEGTVVDLMGGQYSERGKGANVGVWLQCWSGEPIRQKRVGRGWITHPSGTLTMCVMPQPGLVRRLGENADLGERGITARFLYSMPPSNFGGRDYHSLLRPAGQAVRDAYEERLLDIASRYGRATYPLQLRTSSEGTMRWIGWLNETEGRLRPGADLEGKAGWVAKLRGSTLRIAALLHVADGLGQDVEIGPAELERAFVLADYFIAHYVAMHEVWTAGAVPAVQKGPQGHRVGGARGHRRVLGVGPAAQAAAHLRRHRGHRRGADMARRGRVVACGEWDSGACGAAGQGLTPLHGPSEGSRVREWREGC
jgi:hypothetical protein